MPTDRWLVCSMDDGVLRAEPTKAAAKDWFAGFACASRVVVRRLGPGDYEVRQAYEGQETLASAWIVRAGAGGVPGGWDPAQPPLYPLDSRRRFDRVERERAGAPGDGAVVDHVERRGRSFRDGG